jgi:hypothetical protein
MGNLLGANLAWNMVEGIEGPASWLEEKEEPEIPFFPSAF